MTTLEALVHLSRAEAAGRARPAHREVCAGCRDALLALLDELFSRTVSPHKPSLAGSEIMGLTWSVGAVETCAMHPLLLVEEAP